MARPNRETGRAANVFLSWSGERSLYIAKFFHNWLPSVLQRAKPWLSDVDIEKGTVGLEEIKKALAGMEVGVIFITPENRNSLWISYEAGGLAKEINEKSRICTYLLGGLQLQHLTGPLGMFQSTKAEKEDTRKLVHTINRSITGDVVQEAQLNWIFDKMWPEIESHLDKMPQTDEHKKPIRSTEEVLDEILEHERAAANRRKEAEWIDEFSQYLRDLMPAFAEVAKLAKTTPAALLPPQPQPPPLGPIATFCIKLANDSVIKKVQGVFAVETAVGQIAIFAGNHIVAKFESVEAWWRESTITETTQKQLAGVNQPHKSDTVKS